MRAQLTCGVGVAVGVRTLPQCFLDQGIPVSAFAVMACGTPRLLPVFVNVYDVTQHDAVKVINAMLAHSWAPVKLGGVFHVGVEIAGMEWSFGKTLTETRPGVYGLSPGGDRNHSFRERIFLGCTSLSIDAINVLIRDMADEYPGKDYDVFRRNCCHFADDMCGRLGVEPLPDWIYRFARVAASVEDFCKDNFADGGLGDLLPSSLASQPQRPGEKGRRASKKAKRFPIPDALGVDPTMTYQPL